MKCIGSCFPHTGKIQLVTIHAHGLDSLPVSYCESAIQSDIDAGYRVKILPANHEVSNALWTVLLLALIVFVFLAF